MNSACPQEKIKSIIDIKRKEGHSWAEDIGTEGKNIIIKRVPKLGELPKINPKFHALAFKALDIHNRSSVIMLNKDEFSRMKEVFNTSKKDYLGVRKKEYHIILLITGITSFFAFILLPEIVSKIFTLDYQQIIVYIQELTLEPIKIIRDSLIPGVLIWCWIWLIRVLYLLWRGGEISILKLIKLMPLFGDIAKKILSIEGDG